MDAITQSWGPGVPLGSRRLQTQAGSRRLAQRLALPSGRLPPWSWAARGSAGDVARGLCGQGMCPWLATSLTEPGQDVGPEQLGTAHPVTPGASPGAGSADAISWSESPGSQVQVPLPLAHTQPSLPHARPQDPHRFMACVVHSVRAVP